MIPCAPCDSQRAESRKGFRAFRIALRCVRSLAPAPTARSRAPRRHPGTPRQTLRRTCPHGDLPDSVCRHVASFRLGGGYRGVAMPGSRVLSLVRFTCDRSGIITGTTSLPKERKTGRNLRAVPPRFLYSSGGSGFGPPAVGDVAIRTRTKRPPRASSSQWHSSPCTRSRRVP